MDDIWTAFENGTAKQSDAFALYPLWPSETMNGARARNLKFTGLAQNSDYTSLKVGPKFGQTLWVLPCVDSNFGCSLLRTPSD